MIERLNRKIRCRTRVVGSFPDGNSALVLICARTRYVTANEWSTRRYLNMSRLDDNLMTASRSPRHSLRNHICTYFLAQPAREYIHWYSNKRIKQSPGRKSPVKYRTNQRLII